MVRVEASNRSLHDSVAQMAYQIIEAIAMGVEVASLEQVE